MSDERFDCPSRIQQGRQDHAGPADAFTHEGMGDQRDIDAILWEVPSPRPPVKVYSWHFLRERQHVERMNAIIAGRKAGS